MNPEKPKVQKIVIDMGHARTPEERKQKEDREKNKQESTDTPEQKEYPKRLGKVREYINKIINTPNSFDKDGEMKSFWQDVEADLDCGNERRVMEELESRATGEHFAHDAKSIKSWRGAIFEISQEMNSNARLMDSETIGKSFYDEFIELQDQMNKEIDANPGNFTEEEKRKYAKEILLWEGASNELFNNGRSENATSLIEEWIDYKVGYDHNLREAMDTMTKGKKPNIEQINTTREKINANSKKIALYRRMRDSLYAIEFDK